MTAEYKTMASRSTSELYETIQANIREIVKSHLSTSAVSRSPYEAKRTDNAYQAVRLGDEVVQGFRSSQRQVFAGIDLRGKTVLDLGSNLGEVARDAARAGAASVVGVEYDKYFIQMARLIAAHDDLSNVSFVCGDLTKPETYSGRYDIVVALSVFTYVKDFIGPLAAMTNDLLIVETHAVTANWHKVYLKALRQHFAYVALVGVSDHKAESKSDWRYLLLCSQKPLDGIIFKRSRELASSNNLLTLDLSRSRIQHLDAVLETIGGRKSSSIEANLEAASAYIGSTPPGEALREIAKGGIVRSPQYWSHYLVGYGEYRKRGRFDERNSYYRLIQQLVENGLYDSAFRNLFTRHDGGKSRLLLRYNIFDELLSNGTGESLEPIVLYDIIGRESFPESGPNFELFLNEIADPVFPVALDGHHRIFASYILGAQRLRMVPVWYENIRTAAAFIKRRPEALKDIWASVYPFSQRLASNGAFDAEFSNGGRD